MKNPRARSVSVSYGHARMLYWALYYEEPYWLFASRSACLKLLIAHCLKLFFSHNPRADPEKMRTPVTARADRLLI